MKPTGEAGAGFRECSDLYFEPLANDATRGRLWGACTYDPGDGGSFRSVVCPVAILDRTPGRPVVVKPVCIATQDEHLGGHWRLLKVTTPAEERVRLREGTGRDGDKRRF